MYKKEDSGSYNYLWIAAGVMGVIAAFFYVTGGFFVANLLVFFFLLWLLERFVLRPLIRGFNRTTLPKIEKFYHDSIQWVLTGRRPWFTLLGTVLFLFFSIFLLGIVSPKVVFFPENEPNFVYVYNEMPAGTDLDETNRVTKLLEDRVYDVIGQDNPVVKSVISNIAIGATPPNSIDPTPSPNKSKVSVEFVDYQYRDGVSTQELLVDIRENVQDIPGTVITVDKEQNGPPTGKPINIEITGDEFDQIISLTERVKSFIQDRDIAGIEELQSDLQVKQSRNDYRY